LTGRIDPTYSVRGNVKSHGKDCGHTAILLKAHVEILLRQSEMHVWAKYINVTVVRIGRYSRSND
jgi:hypothetical protein